MRVLLLLLAFPAFGDFQGTVIYGEDNRIDAHETADPFLHSLAESSVALIPAASLIDSGDGLIRATGPLFGESKKLCSEERFYHQETPAFCSGVLVAEDLVLTAGHCVDSLWHCRATRFVFGYQIRAGDSFPAGIPEENIFGCAEIVQKDPLDFALIRLDRRIARRSAKLSHSRGKIGLTAVGYPMGLPLKFAVKGRVRRQSHDLLETNLDTFGGNSGSPVFNSAGELEGIIVNGEEDFKKAKGRNCYVSKRCGNEKCAGEDVLKVSSIFSRLRPALSH